MKNLIRKILKESILGDVVKKVYHVSTTPITNIDNRFLFKQSPRDKPEGLWFTYDKNRWEEFFYSDNTENYFTYEITIDTSKLIKLDSIEKIDSFNEKYGSEGSIFKQNYETIQEAYNLIWTSPNWMDVKRDYDGIEFPNFEELSNYIDFDNVKNHWLTFIDVNSGCVWNSKSIINFKRVD